MAVRLEHANLTVRDVEEAIRFLQTAFPEFRVRGEGKSQDGSRWVHIGTDEMVVTPPTLATPPPNLPPASLLVTVVPMSVRLPDLLVMPPPTPVPTLSLTTQFSKARFPRVFSI